MTNGAATVTAAIRSGGLDVPDDLVLDVTGLDEPLLPSPHHLATAASAARLLTGVGADALWRSRGHAPQRLSVDARHASAALVSFAHVRHLDEATRPDDSRRRAASTLTRIFPTADGRHVQLHASFSDGPKVLELLGVAPDSAGDVIEKSVGAWNAFELEDALVERRLCGGVVRSVDEWAAHPQGRAIAGRPVVTITKIGDAPVEPLPAGGRPASGVRVLDLTRVLAGPTCAKTWAEHGADVLHVSAPHLERQAPFEVETGFGKRQTFLDLRDADAAATLRALATTADVFVQGYRQGAMARRGLGPDDLAAARPGIVYVSENCYGPVGPWSERPGWEQLAQAATGMSYAEGKAIDEAPKLAPAAVNDYTTGYLAAYGAMVALAKRATEGGSWLVEASLAQTCSWVQALGADLDPRTAKGAPGDVRPFLAEIDSDSFGRLRYLTPALTMSDTPPRWERPPSRLGTHEPVWLDRS